MSEIPLYKSQRDCDHSRWRCLTQSVSQKGSEGTTQSKRPCAATSTGMLFFLELCFATLFLNSEVSIDGKRWFREMSTTRSLKPMGSDYDSRNDDHNNAAQANSNCCHHSLWRCLTQSESWKGSEGTDTVQASVRSHFEKESNQSR